MDGSGVSGGEGCSSADLTLSEILTGKLILKNSAALTGRGKRLSAADSHTPSTRPPSLGIRSKA